MPDKFYEYYSRKDVQEAILRVSENREVAPRFGEGFGRRPDIIQFPGDILEMAKKGATSFHVSEERWNNPLTLKPGMAKKDLDENRIGWDLCLPEFEEIYLVENGLLQRKKISYLDKYIDKKQEGKYSINSDLKIISINPQDYSLKIDPIKKIFVRKKRPLEKIFKIILDDGKIIFVSEDHPILIFTENGIVNKKAKEITTKDYLLIPLKINFKKDICELNLIDLMDIKDTYPVGDKIELSKYIIPNQDRNISSYEKKYFSKQGIPINKIKNLSEIKEFGLVRCKQFIFSKIDLNREMGFLIGLYLAEGCSSEGRIEFSLNKEEHNLANKILKTINSLFSFNPNKATIQIKGNSLKLRLNGKVLNNFFVELLNLGKLATKKKIPNWVYSANKDFSNGILEGYFIGDGHIRYDNNHTSIKLSASTVSPELFKGITMLLQLKGISYKIKKEIEPKGIGKHQTYEIIIEGFEEINNMHKSCKYIFEYNNIKIRSKKIKHPSIHDRYPPFIDKIKISKLKNEALKKNIYRAVRLGMRMNKEDLKKVANSNLLKIIESNIFPIRIKKIEEIEYSGYLYDIETETHHNFLQGDGVFTHNCLDIDTPYWDYAKYTGYFLIEALKFHDVKNISVKFSGGKGFHITIPFESFPSEVNGIKIKNWFPEGPRIIAAYLQDMIKEMLINKILEKENLSKICERTGKKRDEITDKKGKFDPFKIIEIDTVLISNRHLFRAPYSLHEKTGLVSLPIDPNRILEFEKKEAEPLRVKTDRNYLERDGIKCDAKNLIIQAFDWWGKNHEKKGPDVVAVVREFKLPANAISEEYFPYCIKKILEGNMEDGKKRALFILVNFLRSMGWRFEDVEAKIKEWNKRNKNPLGDSYIAGQLLWNKKQDSVLPPNCSNNYYKDLQIKCPNCMKYKNPVNFAKSKLKEAEDKLKKK